jgi:hypothetical protein
MTHDRTAPFFIPAIIIAIAANVADAIGSGHTKDVVGNRLTKERLDFVYPFAFPPTHTELLPVRENKRSGRV